MRIFVVILHEYESWTLAILDAKKLEANKVWP